MPVKMTKKAEIENRRTEVVAANLLAGLNYRDMASGLDVSLGTIANDVKIILGRWQKEQVETTEPSTSRSISAG